MRIILKKTVEIANFGQEVFSLFKVVSQKYKDTGKEMVGIKEKDFEENLEYMIFFIDKLRKNMLDLDISLEEISENLKNYLNYRTSLTEKKEPGEADADL